MDRLERLAVHPVEAVPPLVPHVDRTDLTQHAEMLGHLRLGKPELADEVVHRTLTAGEEIQDLPPPWLSHGVERVRRGRCSGHGDNIYTDISICQGVTIDDVERAVHDRGGWPTEAPIDRTEHELADWELLMDAIAGALAQHDLMNVDELRRSIESMEPAAYENATYYERWLFAAETILEEKSIFAAGELDARVAR